jgi:hypothetical protein
VTLVDKLAVYKDGWSWSNDFTPQENDMNQKPFPPLSHEYREKLEKEAKEARERSLAQRIVAKRRTYKTGPK